MKSRIMTCISAMTLFAALAIAVRLRLVAQEWPTALGQATGHTRYKLVDIGTLGGPASYINPAETFGSFNQINSRGTAVGGADSPIPTTPTSNFFVCGGPEGVVPFVNRGFEWQNGAVSDLGVLGGADSCSVATSISTSGAIVGYSENGVIDPVLGITEVRAVLWKNGEIEDLGTFGGNHSAAAAINSRSQVVGFALNPVPDPLSVFDFLVGGVSTGTQTRAFLWQNGQMQDLGTLGGPDAIAFLLSERGQVGGWSYTNSVPNPSTGIPTVDPFLWENGTMRDLGTLGGTFGSPSALNNRGQVVGVSNLTGDQTSELFLWEKGKLTDLTTQSIGGTFLVANAISDAGQIVGGGAFPGRVFDASLWKNGVLTDLGTLDDDCYSIAVAINPRGQVVGSSFACDFSIIRGFLWENGSMVDLNTLIPPDSGLQLMLPETINDSGEIAGNGVLSGSGCADADVCGHAFVLIPAGGDGATGATTATQNDDAPVNRRPMTGTQLTATSKEIMARINARIGRRHGIPGLGARLRK